jgi:hypothetical protein
MISDARPGTVRAQRVAVVCAADEQRDRTRGHLQRFGIDVRAVVGLADLKATAERCEVMVIFADGFQDATILEGLSAVEGWQTGPTLIVVTDHVPPLWPPQKARVRPAMIVAYASWVRLLCDTIGVRPLAGIAEVPEIEPSGPELPFTD